MLRRATTSTNSSTLLLGSHSSNSSSSCVSSLVNPSLFATLNGARTRKRPKVGVPYIKEAQQWREKYQSKQQRVLADSLRAYVTFGNNRRVNPWDPRFKPFDREENDGVYVVMRYLMKEKLEASRNHAGAVKRLMCNVGLIGPKVTTQARWRGRRSVNLSDKAVLATDNLSRDKTIQNRWYSD